MLDASLACYLVRMAHRRELALEVLARDARDVICVIEVVPSSLARAILLPNAQRTRADLLFNDEIVTRRDGPAQPVIGDHDGPRRRSFEEVGNTKEPVAGCS